MLPRDALTTYKSIASGMAEHESDLLHSIEPLNT